MMEPNFSLDDFKKWMRGQKDLSPLDKPKRHRDVLGTWVESKVSVRRLLDTISSEIGDLDEIAADFKQNGGTIEDVDGKNFLIEVKSGQFSILRHYVRAI